MSVVGIDLGTTNTVVACVKMGRVHVIADEHGERLLPSVVSFHPNGQVLVGAEAKARLGVDGKNTISSVKRLIGRSWHSEELTKARSRFPFEMREGPGQGPLVLARGQEYTLPEISAFVLKKAKQIAEAALGEAVDKAVITVPAHFNELQRASTKVAGRVAGLEVLRILNEPTAAALAYGLGRQNNERIAVYDFGGGTFDCTLLDLSGNVFEVLASSGDTFLGGDDVDTAIAERMAESFLRQYRFDPRTDPQAFARLKLAAEQVKIELSTTDQTQISLREIGYGVGGTHLDLTFGLNRGELESIIEPMVERSFKVTQDALSLARLTPSAFDHVILVGGSTRTPVVRRRVESFFGMAPLDRVNPDEVVAIGAAIQAAALSDQLRRRSIPPPPDPGPAQAPGGMRVPPTQHVPTRRGLADVSVRSPRGPEPEEVTSTHNVQHRVDANTDVTGQDATLSLHPNQPAAPQAEMETAPTPAADWMPQGPMSRTLPLDQQAPPQGAFGDGQATMSRPSATAAIGTQRLPGAPISPAAGRPPRSIPPPPRTAPNRPAPGGRTTTAPRLPPEPPQEDPSMTQEFPDLQELPMGERRSGRPIPPPPKRGGPPSAAPSTTPNQPRPPSLKPNTPSQGFDAFGAIDEMPSIMSISQSGPGAKVPSLPGQPSPLGTDTMPNPAAGPRIVPAAGQPPPPPQQQQYQTGGRGPTAQSPQYQQAPPPQQYAAPLPPQQQPYPPLPPDPFGPFGAPQGYGAPQPQGGYAPAQPVQMAPYANANPYGATQSSAQMPDMRAPPPINMNGPPGIAVAPSLGPGGRSEVLPPAVGGFSVSPGGQAPVLVDVTPRALVVEVVGGYCDTVIPRNAKIPCERQRQFTTGSDYQSVVRVRVAQGEHAQFIQNTYLGEVELSGIRPGIRGEVTIGVTFELDADGSLRVRARDVGTGQEAIATLQLVGLASDESSIVMMIDRMAQQQIAH